MGSRVIRKTGRFSPANSGQSAAQSVCSETMMSKERNTKKELKKKPLLDKKAKKMSKATKKVPAYLAG